MKRLTLFAALLLFTATGYSQSESKGSVPKQTIAAAAAHLPPLTKYNGKGKKVTIDKRSYSNESVINITNWAKQHPDEVVNYKNVVSPYLHDANVSTFSAAEKEAYNELKAQWTLVNDLTKNK